MHQNHPALCGGGGVDFLKIFWGAFSLIHHNRVRQLLTPFEIEFLLCVWERVFVWTIYPPTEGKMTIYQCEKNQVCQLGEMRSQFPQSVKCVEKSQNAGFCGGLREMRHKLGNFLIYKEMRRKIILKHFAFFWEKCVKKNWTVFYGLFLVGSKMAANC